MRNYGGGSLSRALGGGTPALLRAGWVIRYNRGLPDQIHGVS
jgi:hypothetical protein